MSDDEVTLRVNTSDIESIIRRIDAITTRFRTAPRRPYGPGAQDGPEGRRAPRPTREAPRPTRPGERRAPDPVPAAEEPSETAGPTGPRRRSLRDRIRQADPIAEAALAFPRRLVGGLVGLIAADRILDTILRGAQGQTFERIVRDTVRQLPGIATLDKVRQIVREQSKGDRVALLAEVDARIARANVSKRLSESPAAQREAARSAAEAYERSPERRAQLRRAAERRLGR